MGGATEVALRRCQCMLPMLLCRISSFRFGGDFVHRRGDAEEAIKRQWPFLPICSTHQHQPRRGEIILSFLVASHPVLLLLATPRFCLDKDGAEQRRLKDVRIAGRLLCQSRRKAPPRDNGEEKDEPLRQRRRDKEGRLASGGRISRSRRMHGQGEHLDQQTREERTPALSTRPR